jgi:hypothetical protein
MLEVTAVPPLLMKLLSGEWLRGEGFGIPAAVNVLRGLIVWEAFLLLLASSSSEDKVSKPSEDGVEKSRRSSPELTKSDIF